MDIARKVVTRLPLQQLWRGGEFTARGKSLKKNEITDLLCAGPVQFVVADLGSAPRWIDLGDCYNFWKVDAKLHIADPESKSRLEDFPGKYLYFASQWENKPGEAPIVVLERHH